MTVTIKELIKQLQSIPKEYEDYEVRVLYDDIDEDTVDTFDPSENFWVDSVGVNDCRRLAKELVIVGYRHLNLTLDPLFLYKWENKKG